MRMESTPAKICQKDCEMHIFSIKAKQPNVQLSEELRIDCCPTYSRSTTQSYENIIPQFNNDGKVYMPAFLLAIDQPDLKYNMAKYQQEHRQKVKESSRKRRTLVMNIKYVENLPKPADKCNYCGVCRENFSEYLSHIESTTHQSKFREYECLTSVKNIIREFEKENHFKTGLMQVFRKMTEKTTIESSTHEPQIRPSAQQRRSSKESSKHNQSISQLQSNIDIHYQNMKRYYREMQLSAVVQILQPTYGVAVDQLQRAQTMNGIGLLQMMQTADHMRPQVMDSQLLWSSLITLVKPKQNQGEMLSLVQTLLKSFQGQ